MTVLARLIIRLEVSLEIRKVHVCPTVLVFLVYVVLMSELVSQSVVRVLKVMRVMEGLVPTLTR